MEQQSIRDSDHLWRRVLHAPPDFVIKPDGTPSSTNFQLRHNETGLSVNIARLSELNIFNPSPSKYHVYSLPVLGVKGLGLDCIPVPLIDNIGHAEIRGNFSKKTSRALAKLSASVS